MCSKFMLACLVLAASGAAAQSLVPVARVGGRIMQPVPVGEFLYVPAGAGLDVWSLADAAHPAHVGHTSGADEVPGVVRDIVAAGNHLYVEASWPDPGVAVYSLADPAHPALVGHFDIDTERLGTDGSHLFLAGISRGIRSFDLADPVNPVELDALDVPLGYVDGIVVGDGRMVVSSTTQSQQPQVWFVDISDPTRMQATSTFPICGWACILEGDYLISPGFGFAVYDAHDPANPVSVFAAPEETVELPVLDHDVLWTFGDELRAWDASTLTHPVQIGSAPNEATTLGRVALTSHGPFEIDTAGHGILIDGSTPASPHALAEIDVPGGGEIEGGAVDAQYAYLADPAFGLRIVTSPGLAPVGALAIGTGDSRGAHDVALAGNIAFVVGSEALHAVDVADPRHPVEIGSVAAEFYSRVVVDGDRAYLASIYQLANLTVVSVGDPAHMRIRGTLSIDMPYDIVARGNRVYAAVASGITDVGSGLRIVDVSDPDAPVVIGAEATCGDADVGRSIAFLGATGSDIALGCFNGAVHLIDASSAGAPVELGVFMTNDVYATTSPIAVAGNVMYVGLSGSIGEYDISNRASPVRTGQYETAAQVSRLLRSSDALIAITGLAGTYSFGSPASSTRRTHSHHTRPARPSFEP